MQKHAYLLFLLLVAAKAPAFQAKIAPSGEANNIENALYQSPAMTIQTIHPGVCSAVSINGCGCPFCTQLRSIGR
ncbi:hypothetical protein HC231_15025 [Brenneria izadpanahii]|uniref:Uncharacterized protein n=2 Tax=Brenneria izadpanahii TaxID=2722756 RepID=A0ABX7V1R6_9GAMM|nr:hypothetical protein HC231_15025 [Brenneria izadpanahii]